MICPKCGSRDVHRSQAHNALESIIKASALFRTYRCHACGWRSWRRARGPIETGERQKQFILFIAVVIIALLSAYLLQSLVLR